MPVKSSLAADDRPVGARIRAARKGAGLSVDDLAGRVSVHRGTVYRWETQGAVPEDATIRQLAAVLGTSAAWLRYGGSEEPPREVEEERPEDAVHDPREVDTGEVSDGGPSLSEFERSIRAFAGRSDGIDREERRLRILDALDAQKRGYAALSLPVPAWVYRLQAELDAGKL